MITGIGSLPFTDIDAAIDAIFSTCREIPFWPQLPKKSFYENMYSTFLEGTPGLITDEPKSSVYIDTTKTEGIEEFYENVYTMRLHTFAISEKAAGGLYRFLERLNEIKDHVQYIKGQITGPFSIGLGLKDENGKSILYNYGFFDIIKKTLHMKAHWMVSIIKQSYPDKEIIIFFDEPFLVSFGSAYVSVPKEEVISSLNEVCDGLEAITGVHCCGNTDWSILLKSNIHIINYDAFNFMDTLFYFSHDVEKFLKRGGTISPGIVPSSEKALTVPVEDLVPLWKRFVDHLSVYKQHIHGRDIIITPSCGLGSLELREAIRAMELLKELDMWTGQAPRIQG